MREKSRRQKKSKLAKANKHTKWAPYWSVLRKFGPGKRIHPSKLTHRRRHWRITKLKIKPRRIKKPHLG
jgi:ribosomal protein L39E